MNLHANLIIFNEITFSNDVRIQFAYDPLTTRLTRIHFQVFISIDINPKLVQTNLYFTNSDNFS